MNQMRRPPMPPRSGPPMSPRNQPQQAPTGHYWPRHHYYPYDCHRGDYYDWYYYDWQYNPRVWGDDDYDRAPSPNNHQSVSKLSSPKSGQYLNVAPTLIANLLEHASKEQPTMDGIQCMLDRMVSIAGIGWDVELDMGYYDEIIARSATNKQPVPPQPPTGE